MSLWSKVKIVPLSPPQSMIGCCGAKSFFVNHRENENIRDKAVEIIREICRENLLRLHEEELNIRSLRNLVQSLNFKINMEDDTIDRVLDTALKPWYEKIYRIISIEPSSNCEACRLGEKGQLAHMQEGCCLYIKRESEEN